MSPPPQPANLRPCGPAGRSSSGAATGNASAGTNQLATNGPRVSVSTRPGHRTKTRTRDPAHGAAKESNLPSVGLPRPAGFEDRMGHQTPAAPQRMLGAGGNL